MPLFIKRVYDVPEPIDGKRVLVDRLWPRGVSKRGSKIDLWLKEIAPSDALRRWFDHDPDKWDEFKKRYFLEMSAKEHVLDELIEMINTETVTLVFAARNKEKNNAVAIQEYLRDFDSSRHRLSTKTAR